MNGLTLGFVIRWMVFCSLALMYCYFFGYYINMYLRKCSEHGFKNIAMGFVTLIAIIQALTWFMVGFSLPFSLFFTEVSSIIIISIVFCIYMQKKNSHMKTTEHISKLTKEEIIVTAIFVLIFIVQIVMTLIKYRSDADDSFYVSNSAMFLSEKILNAYDSSMGNRGIAPLTMYNFQIWEAFLSFLSKIISVEPVILTHTLIIPILLTCSAASYVALGKKLFSKDIYVKMFYIMISIFHLMGGFSVYSQGSFLLSRIWQGKAIYLNIVLPLLMVWMLELYENSDNKMNYLKVTICFLAGLALNPTSMYVLGFQMIAMFLTICLKKKSFRIAIYSLPSIILCVIFTVLLYIRTNQYPSYIVDVSKVDMNMIITTFINFFGKGMWYLILYIIFMGVILKIGSNNAKILFTYTPGILFLCVWNPLVGQFIAEKVTKAPAYWRVFWLIPVGTGVAYAVVLIIEKAKMKAIKQVGVLLLCMVIFSLPGRWMFSASNNFINCTNVEKMPNVVLEFGEIISENEDSTANLTLAPSEFNTTLRQKFTNIQLVVSRYIPDLHYYRGENDVYMEKLNLSNFVERIGEDDDSKTINLINQYSVKWIIIKNERIEALDFLCKNNFSIVSQVNEYSLLKKSE